MLHARFLANRKIISVFLTRFLTLDQFRLCGDTNPGGLVPLFDALAAGHTPSYSDDILLTLCFTYYATLVYIGTLFATSISAQSGTLPAPVA